MGFNAYKVRSRGNFDPTSKEPARLSRSKIDLFIECPRCFYLDQRLGLPRPSMPGFTLNNAVDELMKKEFDAHRAKKIPHPFMKAYGLDAVPFDHPDMDIWRDALRHGISYHDKEHNLILRGGIDDVWVTPKGQLHIVDYKATSKKSEISLTDGYKRQVEIYQWLFRKNGFDVSNIAYFVYANGQTDREAFDGKLEFDVEIMPYEGSDTWIPEVIDRMHQTLMQDVVPAKGTSSGNVCEHCDYREIVGKTLLSLHTAAKDTKKSVPAKKKDEKSTDATATLF